MKKLILFTKELGMSINERINCHYEWLNAR